MTIDFRMLERRQKGSRSSLITSTIKSSRSKYNTLVSFNIKYIVDHHFAAVRVTGYINIIHLYTTTNTAFRGSFLRLQKQRAVRTANSPHVK